MAALDFCIRGKHKPTAAFFNHKTPFSQECETFLKDYCQAHSIPLVIGHIDSPTKPPDLSPEEYWRVERYKFLHFLQGRVITAHNLDDNCESYLFGAINGRPDIIPYRNQNVIRPFMLNPKCAFIEWCRKHDVPWKEDPSNSDVRYARNRIRHNIIPEVLKVNPGLHKVVAKKVREMFESTEPQLPSTKRCSCGGALPCKDAFCLM